MNKSVKFLLVTQFATAFADRAIFFILFVIISQFDNLPDWYTPLLQLAFILAYVLFAPWAGSYSDGRPKRNVLLQGNLIKLMGLGILFLYTISVITQWAILLGYFLIGFGAVMFSPAKYGLLPELVEEEKLVKINAWLEGSTIVAILAGQYIGASLGEFNISIALIIAAVIYGLSTLLALGVKVTPVEHKPKVAFFKNFITDYKVLMQHHIVRFALLGVSLFWSVAAILQVLLLDWAKTAVHLEHVSDISILGIFIGVGIVIGSIVVPNFISLHNLRRTRFAAYSLGAFVVVLSQLSHIYPVYLVLIMIGISGGILVVPINAALEEIGHQTVGSGGAVAVQRFSENLSMLLSLLVYTAVLALEATPETIMLIMGVLVLTLTALIGLNLPHRDTELLEDET
jgi:LPLT family lysophospholipid transporter-like MFS transporter